MILNTWCEEEVNGHVVGEYLMIGTLRYAGRAQGMPFFAASEAALQGVAESRLAEIKRDLGPLFRDLFPDEAWALRIHP